MKNTIPVYCYLFKGNWTDRFEELTLMTEKGKIDCFELWVPMDKSRNHHLIISYGRPLTKTYCLVKMIWKTSPDIFSFYYGQNRELFIIHKGSKGVVEEKGPAVAKNGLPV
jgi:hypothetical protein